MSSKTNKKEQSPKRFVLNDCSLLIPMPCHSPSSMYLPRRFHTSFPMELEGRITQPQFQHLINEINSHLQSAYSPQSAFWENVLAILTWHTSLFWWRGRFETELRKVEQVIERANDEVYNGLGLNVLSPRHVGLQFLEIEYY